MDLILWRHAEAEDWTEGCNDLERALTPRGEKQAHRMAQWLERQLPETARILCSPARRCEQTALALGRKYRLREELAPERGIEDLLLAAQWPDSRHVVVLVGHQPSLGATIAHLLQMRHPQLALRKGSLWWLRTRERDGHSQTVVVTVQAPDFL